MIDEPGRRDFTSPPEHRGEANRSNDPGRSNPSGTATPRRRASDREQADQPPENPRARRRRRARDFFQRFREPLIGIGLAGAAAPFVKPAEPAEAPPPEDDVATPAQAPSTATAEAAGAEEQVATQIAATRADQVRADTIQDAVQRYRIGQELAEAIYDHATENGIEPRLAYGLVRTESAFKHDAISHVGARGLTQVMPRTAAWLRPGTRADDLHERNLNLSLGFRYLNQLIDKYGGDVKLALLAYNRGPGTVDRILSRGGDPDNGYARKVLSD